MIRMEIEDLETGCTYIKDGKTESECVKSFKEMFFDNRPYKILWRRKIS